jgi:hypothetical protein
MAFLDEVAERLLAIQDLIREEHAEGIVESIEPLRVTETVRKVEAVYGNWFSVTIVNDGPDDVYAIVNSRKSSAWHRVAVNEPYKVDMGRGVIRDVLLRCEPGETASVRLVGAR